jgi:acyl carrier protein
MNEGLIAEIRELFAKKLAIEVESPVVDLLDTGLVDSVSLVELLLALEQEFGVSVPLEELEMDDFRSIARIAELVGRVRIPVVAPSRVPSLGAALPENAASASNAAA